jgi:hypothetical protein
MKNQLIQVISIIKSDYFRYGGKKDFWNFLRTYFFIQD